MTKKGLTLIELLAVITIMGLLLLVVLPGVARLSEKANDRQYEQAVTILKGATKAYLDQVDNNGLHNVGDSKDITIEALAQAKFITLPFTNPKTKETLAPTAIIKVRKIGINEYSYELPL